MSDFAKYCLFNFSASINGGGLKRLEEYSYWFDQRGGSQFIISNNTISDLKSKFKNNTYLEVNQSFWDRVFRDQSYIETLPINFDDIKFYYSYGIPVYKKIGNVNCFHISNIAPFKLNVEKSFIDIFRNYLLRKRFINYLDIPEIISAESKSSLKYLPVKYKKKFMCLQNGSDDEINFVDDENIKRENIAVSVGTHPYKRLDRVIDCFKFISQNHGITDLYIFGQSKNIKVDNPNIHLMGNKPRSEVISMIAKSKFYITCTTTENSYNAASEGVFISNSSLISMIGPHRELLENETKKVININGNDMYLVERNNLKKINIIYWDDIIKKMLKAGGMK